MTIKNYEVKLDLFQLRRNNMILIDNTIFFTKDENGDFLKMFKRLNLHGFVHSEDFKSRVHQNQEYVPDFGWSKMSIKLINPEKLDEMKNVVSKRIKNAK